MIQAHHDEIWDIGFVQFGDNVGPNNHLYAATFNVSFADDQEWQRIWRETVSPIADHAIEEGILNGIVLLTHNTGGAHNSKVLYLFEEWDDIDNWWEMFFGMMEEHHPEEFEATMAMIQEHDDIIWSLPPSGN